MKIYWVFFQDFEKMYILGHNVVDYTFTWQTKVPWGERQIYSCLKKKFKKIYQIRNAVLLDVVTPCDKRAALFALG